MKTIVCQPREKKIKKLGQRRKYQGLFVLEKEKNWLKIYKTNLSFYIRTESNILEW